MSITLVGAIIAVFISTLAWQLVLLQLARTAELHWGPHLDPPVIGVGTTIILVATFLIALRAAHVAAMETRGDTWRARRVGPHARTAHVDTGSFLPLALGLRHVFRRRAVRGRRRWQRGRRWSERRSASRC